MEVPMYELTCAKVFPDKEDDGWDVQIAKPLREGWE